jgi:hypothetical protein
MIWMGKEMFGDWVWHGVGIHDKQGVLAFWTEAQIIEGQLSCHVFICQYIYSERDAAPASLDPDIRICPRTQLIPHLR